ncbi:cell division cycle 123 family protein [Agrobacterium vaccinii]|uniref:cell division cycle 123 family protein n=1 Tax=Agrobacterium vaccinii TaxID=2735528 RepID=UPI001E643AC1|nr:cell division cycle 123 family protein [Agrobacterium vaccinii]
MEHWPDEVIALGLPVEHIILSDQDRLAIGARTAAFRDIFEIDEIPPFTDGFYTAIDEKVAIFPSGGHARLGGCSFKKPGFFQKAPISNSRDLAPHLLQDNPRVAGLLASSLQHKFDVGLFIRPWQDIPQWTEFRLFLNNRAFIGASQYFHTMVFPEIEQSARFIASALIDFADEFLSVSHLDDAIVDVFVNQNSESGWRALLIDINPLIRRADACLFHWQNDGDFDRGLRFRGRDGRVLSMAPLPFARAS